MNYYNEIDPYCCQWLRNLIAAKLIPEGVVDDRSILDVRPVDLAGFKQCHFFAGIAGWSRALALAAVSPDRALWTGSCPCQPFSTAGARRGFDDERHLWPHWFYLIRVCKPPVILGEQVARGGKVWLDLVRADLEKVGYAFGACVLPACSVGAAHERKRVWFVADADEQTKHVLSVDAEVADVSQAHADVDAPRLSWGREAGTNGAHAPGVEARNGFGHGTARVLPREHWTHQPVVGGAVHGIYGRLDQVRALGNAIVPACAAEFIVAALCAREAAP